MREGILRMNVSLATRDVRNNRPINRTLYKLAIQRYGQYHRELKKHLAEKWPWMKDK